ncbi:hypothetical protein N7450_010399 [Penicillium hetheringtonii]|uniref:Glycine zipper 2TM domain-containing protein n=1 Tax=Penicillium hetheringtonii TaxID=911720 RepID=A0AAD6D855_9EURO|nr:hypothetical protein N7450_010399 [Penicillium hetheringtonii]
MAQYFNPRQSASDPYSDAHQGQQSQMYLLPQQGSFNPDYPPQQSLYTPNPQSHGQVYDNAAPTSQPSMTVGENASYYGTVPSYDQYGRVVGTTGPEDERGLGSTLVGGAAGGYAGHKLGGGFLGSAAGALIGAVGMNAATHQV